MEKLVVGIDLGGTNTVAIAVAPDGKIVGRNKTTTRTGQGVKKTAVDMRETAKKALAEAGATWDDAKAAGIAIPASIDPQTGDLLHAPNLGWKNQPAVPTFSQIFELPVYLENDVNCGTLAEHQLGAAKGCRSVVGFFVGTGLGGGIIINDLLYTGKRGLAGELGHQVIKVGGRKCGCGNSGCLEAYCSKTGFGKAFHKLINVKGKKSVLTSLAGEDFRNVKSGILRKAYEQDDKITKRVLHQGARYLGIAAANTMAAISPECIVFGGGVIEALGKALLPVIRGGVGEALFGIDLEDVDLRLTDLGDDAVPLGAAVLAQSKGNLVAR